MAAPLDIFIAYPPPNHTTEFDHVLFEGSVTPGASLSVSGRKINVAPDGLFIEWLPLQHGENLLQLQVVRGAERSQSTFRVTSNPAQPSPAAPTVIRADSISPRDDVKLYDLSGSLSSRTLNIAFEGSPGGIASFMVGNHGPFPLVERKAEDFPGAKSVVPRRYEASFVFRRGDQLQDAAVVISLSGVDGRTVTATAEGKITVDENAPLRVGIVTEQSVGMGVNASANVARNGPRRSHILQLKIGAKFPIIGEEGDTYRVPIAPNQNVNILKNQVRLLPVGAPMPRVYLPRIETRRGQNEGRGNWTQVRFLLPERVLFAVEQSSAPRDQSLDVRLYHTESDIDYMVSQFPDDLVRDIRWTQESDGVLRTRIDLATRQQWGFQTFYEGNTLVLQIKHPPSIDAARPLRGRRILVDAGHGGSEFGAPGALRVPEKDIVLLIARILAEKLRARGADVTLSREADITVPLYNRALRAEATGAEILLSVHANALPDGVDPVTRRGSSVHFFHPQSRTLADTLLRSLTTQIPELGNAGIHYQNLALTRPTSQLSVLVETAYMTDTGNLRFLMSVAGRERLAEALARGVEEFFRAQTIDD